MSLKEKAESKAKEYQVADVCRVWNGGCPNVRHASMEMFEWAKQELINKACEWLEDNLVQCWIEDFLYVQFKHHEHQEKENVLADFRKAMEE